MAAVKRVECYGDSRIFTGCFHCGGKADTVDHAPPKVLLDKPYPDEMIAVPACYACNNGASIDESWLACVVECTVTGEVEPNRGSREAVAKMLTHSPALAASMAAMRTIDENGTIFQPDVERVRRIVTKIARAHAAYELHEHFEHEPSSVQVFPLPLLSDDALQDFETLGGGGFAMWPEVGSPRAKPLEFVLGLYYYNFYGSGTTDQAGMIGLPFLVSRSSSGNNRILSYAAFGQPLRQARPGLRLPRPGRGRRQLRPGLLAGRLPRARCVARREVLTRTMKSKGGGHDLWPEGGVREHAALESEWM